MTKKAIEVANKMQLSDNPLWLEVKRLACDYEKQIAVDAEHITALQKTNGYLTDRVNYLEAQIEKMKCCYNCEHFDFTEPNYCYKGVYRECQYVCDKWVLREIKEK